MEASERPIRVILFIMLCKVVLTSVPMDILESLDRISIKEKANNKHYFFLLLCVHALQNDIFGWHPVVLSFSFFFLLLILGTSRTGRPCFSILLIICL